MSLNFATKEGGSLNIDPWASPRAKTSEAGRTTSVDFKTYLNRVAYRECHQRRALWKMRCWIGQSTRGKDVRSPERRCIRHERSSGGRRRAVQAFCTGKRVGEGKE